MRHMWLLPLCAAVTALGFAPGASGAKTSRGPGFRSDKEVDVSNLRGPQSEAAIAIDPRHPRVLLAGSNDIRAKRVAVYSSTDGGRHWQARHLPGPPGIALCATSDPSVAIDRRGRQYYAFIGLGCGRRSLSLYIARRAGPNAAWHTAPLAVGRTERSALADDRPMLIVDNGSKSPHRGRLYVGWTRFFVNANALTEPDSGDLLGATAVISHSDDGGRRWSTPYSLSSQGTPLELRLATGPAGELYAVWRDGKTDSIYIARSATGSAFSRQSFVAGAVVLAGHRCHRLRARIPAQPRRCVSPNPVVSVDTSSGPRRGRVYVTYGSTALNRSQDVYVAAFDPRLTPVLGVRFLERVNTPEGIGGPDQFLPTSAVDATTGRLWACYYQSLGRARKRARFLCTASDDGGKRWFAPQVVSHLISDETTRVADRGNGYGDYEGVAAGGKVAHAIWTDGRYLRRRAEEIYTTTLSGES